MKSTQKLMLLDNFSEILPYFTSKFSICSIQTQLCVKDFLCKNRQFKTLQNLPKKYTKSDNKSHLFILKKCKSNKFRMLFWSRKYKS